MHLLGHKFLVLFFFSLPALFLAAAANTKNRKYSIKQHESNGKTALQQWHTNTQRNDDTINHMNE